MVGTSNVLGSCAHDLAAELKPRDFEDHWEGGFVYTDSTSFTPRCAELARKIIKRVASSKRGILVDQARGMGSGPINVFGAMNRKCPSHISDTRQLTSEIAVACIIHSAWGIVCSGPYTRQAWERVNR